MALYVVHFCRNRSCNVGWIDEDLTNATSPPKWKYCPECVQQGFVNPDRPPKSEAAIRKAMLMNQRLKERRINVHNAQEGA